MSSWNGKNRRSEKDRRKGERRRSVRYTANTLIVIDEVTWLDSESTDRRHKIRRREDREEIARRIIEGSLE
jgi:hypothetical protein